MLRPRGAPGERRWERQVIGAGRHKLPCLKAGIDEGFNLLVVLECLRLRKLGSLTEESPQSQALQGQEGQGLAGQHEDLRGQCTSIACGARPRLLGSPVKDNVCIGAGLGEWQRTCLIPITQSRGHRVLCTKPHLVASLGNTLPLRPVDLNSNISRQGRSIQPLTT